MVRSPLSHFIGVELDIVRDQLCQLALNKDLNFEDVTSLISDIIFLYQLAQTLSHNVLHFLVTTVMCTVWGQL